MHIQQFNNEGCLSYVVYCLDKSEAAIIDPKHSLEAYANLIREKNLQVKYIIETHTHADHASMAREAAKYFQGKIVMHENINQREGVAIPANIPESIVNIINYNSQIPVDIKVNENMTLQLGSDQIKFIGTPGHTVDGMCVRINHLLFSGDTLLIGQCGRTDLPGGSSEELYHSLFKQLSPLPDDLIIYPAHDYNGGINTALGYERINSPFYEKRQLEEFIQFTKQFFPPPEDNNGGKIQCSFTLKAPTADGQAASPIMNELCFHMEQYLRTAPNDWNGITSQELMDILAREKEASIIDVRQPEELQDIGYIAGAINIPLRQLADRVHELPQNKNQLLVVVCHSGNRSAYGALYLRGYGYTNVKNLEAGMVGWLKNNYPVFKQ